MRALSSSVPWFGSRVAPAREPIPGSRIEPSIPREPEPDVPSSSTMLQQPTLPWCFDAQLW